MKSGIIDQDLRCITSGLKFPEGPIALADGTFLVCEMAAGRITRVDQAGKKSTLCEPGGGPNGLAFGPDGYLYACNNGGQRWTEENGHLFALGQSLTYSGGRIERIDISTGKTTVLYTEGPNGALRGPNDLVFDREGGFWFTDMGKRRPRDMDQGTVYYATPDGRSIREVVHPMFQPNGIALSPDERKLYVAETTAGRVWAFDLVGPGEIDPSQLKRRHKSQLLYGLPGYQLLDSMAVDAAGNICVATIMNGGITVISPHGEFIEHIAMPDDHTTNICFGGEGLSTAYITLSSIGQIIAFEWSGPGLALNFQSYQLLTEKTVQS